jgi:hypothetical protein
MTRHSIVSLIAACALAGCKGETVKKDDQAVKDLQDCKRNLEEKDKRISALQDENARLMTKQSAVEFAVTIEGTCSALKVQPFKGPGAPPIDNKVVAQATSDFLNLVERSHGAIQKCYEQELKKNTGLQVRPQPLTVSASFTKAGAYQDSSFVPSLSDTFNNCIKTVASHWQMPNNSPAMTFQATVTLKPS